MNMRFLLLLLVVLLAFSVGCRKTAVTPSGNSAAALLHENFTAKDMREAILKGCANKNWRAADAGADTIEASLTMRSKHTVVVSIPYTAESYSINYKSSINMKSKDKDDGTLAISGHYNKWVNNLDQAIQQQIAQKKK